MESNHRFLGVDQASWPLDHGAAGVAEAVGVEPTSGTMPPPAFQAGSSTIRMASVSKLRELELNQHDDVQSVASCHWMIPHRLSPETRIVSREFGEEGSNLRLLVQSQTAYH